MKKILMQFAGNFLSKEQMKVVKGGEDTYGGIYSSGGGSRQFSCTASNGATYSGYGDASDVKTFTLIYCGPCNTTCRYY